MESLFASGKRPLCMSSVAIRLWACRRQTPIEGKPPLLLVAFFRDNIHLGRTRFEVGRFDSDYDTVAGSAEAPNEDDTFMSDDIGESEMWCCLVELYMPPPFNMRISIGLTPVVLSQMCQSWLSVGWRHAVCTLCRTGKAVTPSARTWLVPWPGTWPRSSEPHYRTRR